MFVRLSLSFGVTKSLVWHIFHQWIPLGPPRQCVWGSWPSKSAAASSAWTGPPRSSLRPTTPWKRRTPLASFSRPKASATGQWMPRATWDKELMKISAPHRAFFELLQGLHGNSVLSDLAAGNKPEWHLWYFCSRLHKGEENVRDLGLSHRRVFCCYVVSQICLAWLEWFRFAQMVVCYRLVCLWWHFRSKVVSCSVFKHFRHFFFYSMSGHKVVSHSSC